MKKEQYLAKRKKLMDEAQSLIDQGKTEEAQAKMEEVETLDEEWDAIAQAQADFNALNHEPQGRNPFEGDGEGVNIGGAAPGEEKNIYDTKEYRVAFMNYVMRGTPIPEKFNEAGQTKTGDIGSVISPTVINKIIEKMEATGMILPLVTRTSYPAGAIIPTSNVKPVATWVAEGGTSEKQKKGTGQIDIKGYKLRCAISMTLEATVMSLPIFETVFANNVAEAMVKAQEEAIINGDGSGKPKGILAETAKTEQKLELKAADKLNYDVLLAAEAALPLAYEAGAVWNMTKKTFMKFIGMVDSNGQPIARVDHGINGRSERTLLGRQVILNDYMKSIDAEVEADTTVAFLFNWSDYMFNTNYAMRVKTYEDNDTEDKVTKAVMICDGKAIVTDSLVTIVKKSE